MKHIIYDSDSDITLAHLAESIATIAKKNVVFVFLQKLKRPALVRLQKQ